MKRKLFIITAAAVLAAMLTGCSPLGLDAQTLMKPPKATGARQEIYRVLEEKTGDQLTLRYPKAGEYRSAIIMRDVTGDGRDEAIAFYTRGEDPYTIVSVISEVNGTWTEIAFYKNASTQLDRICFGDFDGNGITDFAIGWGNSTAGASELSLYTGQNGTVKEIATKEMYNELAVLELDSDTGRSGILTVALESRDTTAAAKLFGLVNGNVNLLGTAAIDPDVLQYNKVTVGKISAGEYGVILDSSENTHAFQTEILYWDKAAARLQNPLYHPEDKTVLYTARSISVTSQDINGDSIIEIPITHALPGISADTRSEVSYMVNWHRYDSSTNTLTNLLSTVVNSRDGYMFMVPDSWKNRVTTAWDEENRALTFYEWKAETAGSENGVRGDPLLTIQVMTEEEWNNGSEADGALYKIKQHENMVFTAKQGQPASSLALTMEQVEYYFRLFTAT